MHRRNSFYAGRRVMITGGLGFIGSNLARALVALGADVRQPSTMNYHFVYYNVFGVRACSLRLTNVYGPRQLVRHNRQGFIGWFIRLAVEGREIQVYGDGSQLRDFVYVDDVVDAFLAAGMTGAVNGDVFNVGGYEPISHRDLVALLIDVAGSGSVKFVEWPEERKAIDIGSFYSDSSKFAAATGWRPAVDLRDGLRRAVEFYRAHLPHFVEAPA
jgi:UDP-glucose 4-epimerase